MEDIASEIRREREEPRPGVLAVERKSAGDVIGYCGLVFHGNDEPELACELLRRAHGFGYATEARVAVVTWATEAGYERLWATVRAWNVASRRVLEKLGFHETGQVDADAAHGASDGTPLDPWLKTHHRLGATLVATAPRSQTMTGTLAQWERWTGMQFPDSGTYVIPDGLNTLRIDRSRTQGSTPSPRR